MQQHGVVTRNQLYQVGVAPRSLYRRIQSGFWVSHGKRVLVLSGTQDGLATRSRIAGLQIGNSVITGNSALVLRRQASLYARESDEKPWLISRYRASVDARFLRHPDVRWGWLGPWRIATTSHALIDLIRCLPTSEGRNIGYQSLQSGIVTIDALRAASEALIGLGGADRLATVLKDLSSGAHSEAERRLIQLLRQAALVGWAANHRVDLSSGFAIIDVAFPTSLLAIEVDGRAWHSDSRRFVADRRRQNAIVRQGWTVLRFTWEDLTQRPEYVISEIRDGLSISRR